jgi:hypothetical protein
MIPFDRRELSCALKPTLRFDAPERVRSCRQNASGDSSSTYIAHDLDADASPRKSAVSPF